MQLLKNKSRIAVFSGLSLTAKKIQEFLPNAEVFTPVCRGDLLKTKMRSVDVFVIIDGSFDQVLAIAPDEILDVLARGIKVYGASSMGALRAAELDAFGMIGFGEIYNQIRTNVCFRDDFIAQTYAIFSGSIHTLSFTHMDLHFNLLRLVKSEQITFAEQKIIENISAKIFFQNRTWNFFREQILEKTPRTQANRLIAIANKAINHMVTQKYRDALGLLKLIRKDCKEIGVFNKKLLEKRVLTQAPPPPF